MRKRLATRGKFTLASQYQTRNMSEENGDIAVYPCRVPECIHYLTWWLWIMMLGKCSGISQKCKLGTSSYSFPSFITALLTAPKSIAMEQNTRRTPPVTAVHVHLSNIFERFGGLIVIAAGMTRSTEPIEEIICQNLYQKSARNKMSARPHGAAPFPRTTVGA